MAAAKNDGQERVLRMGSQQADWEKETKITIRAYWEFPGAHATWAFAFTSVCQLHLVRTCAPHTLTPDGAISKVIRNHHTEGGGRQVVNIVLPFEGKPLYDRGSPKAAHMRTKCLKFVRSNGPEEERM